MYGVIRYYLQSIHYHKLKLPHSFIVNEFPNHISQQALPQVNPYLSNNTMQIFYYISMKCVGNYYLVLPLERGRKGWWEMGRLPPAAAQSRGSPPPGTHTPWPPLQAPGLFREVGLQAEPSYPSGAEDVLVLGKYKPPQRGGSPPNPSSPLPHSEPQTKMSPAPRESACAVFNTRSPC